MLGLTKRLSGSLYDLVKAGGISSKLDRALSTNRPLALVRVEA
jgi:hypothetical protein